MNSLQVKKNFSRSFRTTLCIAVFALIFAGAAVVFKWPTFMGASTSSNSMSPPAVVPAKEKATASLIFLHGLGDTGHGWAEIFRELKLNHIRSIFPHAPHKPVTLNGGMVMPSWFDIKGLSPTSPEDEEGIKSASKDLQELIAKEVSSGISPERIMIGGFSQGGSVALYTALGTETKVAGLLLMSSWMPLHKQFTSGAFPNYNKDLPVLQCHGEMDPMVPIQWGKASSEIIKSITPNAELKTYPGLTHSSCRKEMEDVKDFLYLTLKES